VHRLEDRAQVRASKLLGADAGGGGQGVTLDRWRSRVDG
jgi:hypothetical protein